MTITSMGARNSQLLLTLLAGGRHGITFPSGLCSRLIIALIPIRHARINVGPPTLARCGRGTAVTIGSSARCATAGVRFKAPTPGPCRSSGGLWSTRRSSAGWFDPCWIRWLLRIVGRPIGVPFSRIIVLPTASCKSNYGDDGNSGFPMLPIHVRPHTRLTSAVSLASAPSIPFAPAANMPLYGPPQNEPNT